MAAQSCVRMKCNAGPTEPLPFFSGDRPEQGNKHWTNTVDGTKIGYSFPSQERWHLRNVSSKCRPWNTDLKGSCTHSIQSLKMEPQFPTVKLGNRELLIGHTIPMGDNGQNEKSAPPIMSGTCSHRSYKATDADLK